MLRKYPPIWIAVEHSTGDQLGPSQLCAVNDVFPQPFPPHFPPEISMQSTWIPLTDPFVPPVSYGDVNFACVTPNNVGSVDDISLAC